MNPKRFEVKLLCADGNTVYLYMGDSRLLAIYTYLKHSLCPAEEGSILTLEEHMGDSRLLAIYTYLKHFFCPAEEGSILTLEGHTRV